MQECTFSGNINTACTCMLQPLEARYTDDQLVAIFARKPEYGLPQPVTKIAASCSAVYFVPN